MAAEGNRPLGEVTRLSRTGFLEHDSAMEAAGLLFIPPALTHLYGSAVHAGLSAAQSLRYNQLCGLMAAEQFLAFEETVIIDAVALLARTTQVGADPSLQEELLGMVTEELAHAGWFRSLLEEIEPALYAGGARPFTRLRTWERLALWPLTRTRDGALLMLWFTLLIEEHSLLLSRELMATPGVDPRFQAVHRRHLVDEARHVPINQRLIACCYDPLPRWRRRLLAGVFRRLLRNLARPRRANVAVINRLISEFPELAPRRRELLRAVCEDFRQHAPASDITHPDFHPRTRVALAQRPEFSGVLQDLERGVGSDGRSVLTGRLAILLAMQIIGSLAYTATAWWAGQGTVHPPLGVMSSLDALVPEVPGMILAYNALGLYLILPAWSSPVRFRTFLWAMVLASLAAYLVFVLYPVELPRGAMPDDEPWKAWYQWLRGLDSPRNSLPSLHVAYAVLVAWACRESRWSLAISLGGGIIIASTVLIRQHVVLDVVCGAFLGAFAWFLGRRLSSA